MKQIINLPIAPVKIGIIGPKSVGKTGLANLLTGHLKSLGVNCDLIQELARRCPLPLNKKTSIDSAYWLVGSQIAAEALSLATKSFTICDRTVIDPYPFVLYSLTRKEEVIHKTSEDMQKLQALKVFICDYLVARPYQFLFYVPIRQELWQTYSVPDDIDFQSKIDEIFRNFLGEFKINFCELKSLSNYERLEEIINFINNFYKND